MPTLTRRRLPTLALFGSFAVVACASANTDPDCAADTAEQRLRAPVAALADPALEGRLAGSPGEATARAYIREQFTRIGLRPASAAGDYEMTVALPADSGAYPGATRSANLIGRLASAAQPNRRVLMIGAHYDHIGHGIGHGSLAVAGEEGQVHPGADDNASGIAVMLETARRLRCMQVAHTLPTDVDFLFAAWSSEEIGVLGSAAFVHSAERNSRFGQIDAYLNLDMVGHLGDALIVQGVGSSAEWPEIVARIPFAKPLRLVRDPHLPTDSTSFDLVEIPALSLFTGAHARYNTPRDTADTLNYAGMNEIADFLTRLTLDLANREAAPRWHAVAAPAQPITRHGVKLYLGTVPDYGADHDDGVHLNGVASGSPAQAAGLRHGDVITALGGVALHSLRDYMSALNALHVDTPAALQIRRDGALVELHITPRARKPDEAPQGHPH